MRKFNIVFLSTLLVFGGSSLACEQPADERYYVETMQEERELTMQAIARSDLILVGTVEEVRHGPEEADPSARISEVLVRVDQVLVGEAPDSITLQAALHQVLVQCFANEAFWDDQVELNGEYIIFVRNGRILSASAPAGSWRKLGLSGQREVVLSVTQAAGGGLPN